MIERAPPGDLIPESEVSAPSWERRPGEPRGWYLLFERYRELGPQRTLRALHRAELVRRGITTPPIKGIPAAWKHAYVRYDWRSRASDWDDFLRGEESARFEAARQEAHEQRVKMLLAFRQLIVRAMGQLSRMPADWADMTRALKAYALLERLELGDDIPGRAGRSKDEPEPGRINVTDLQKLVAQIEANARPREAEIIEVRTREVEDADRSE
jgi:hypothetical protein